MDGRNQSVVSSNELSTCFPGQDLSPEPGIYQLKEVVGQAPTICLHLLRGGIPPFWDQESIPPHSTF